MLSDGHVCRHHLHLVLVLRLAVRILHLFGEDEVELEEEHSPISALPDQLLGIPDLEGVLQDDVTKVVDTDITTIQKREVECVIGLERKNVTFYY